VWYLSNGVSKPFFAALLAAFAQQTGAGRDRSIVLVLDNAGWHTEPNLVVPDGLRLVYLPRYSPELQPAECLWATLDEPIVNKHFDTLADLDAVVAERCRWLDADRDLVKARTGFHWWPKPTIRTDHPESVSRDLILHKAAYRGRASPCRTRNTCTA
jgi:transposase